MAYLAVPNLVYLSVMYDVLKGKNVFFFWEIYKIRDFFEEIILFLHLHYFQNAFFCTLHADFKEFHFPQILLLLKGWVKTALTLQTYVQLFFVETSSQAIWFRICLSCRNVKPLIAFVNFRFHDLRYTHACVSWIEPTSFNRC